MFHHSTTCATLAAGAIVRRQSRAFELRMAPFVARILLLIVAGAPNSNARPTRACWSDDRSEEDLL